MKLVKMQTLYLVGVEFCHCRYASLLESGSNKLHIRTEREEIEGSESEDDAYSDSGSRNWRG